jgi:hypothetical protein
MLTSAYCSSRFGNPKINEAKFMELVPTPNELQIGVIPRKIYMNKVMKKPLHNALRLLKSRGLLGELVEWNGIFTIRKMRGGESLSLHSWGVAIDLNARDNGMGKPPKMSKGFVNCFIESGFDWGGYWKSPDGMHFQLREDLV